MVDGEIFSTLTYDRSIRQ